MADKLFTDERGMLREFREIKPGIYAEVVAVDGAVGGGGGATGGLTNAELRATAVPVSDALLGATNETAPATDIAAAAVNGRLQRIAQRLTSLIAQLPATLGIKTAALSLSVAPASDANLSRETYATVTPQMLPTAAVSGDWAQFATATCSSMDIINATGTTIEYRRGAAGTVFIPIPDGASRLVQGITNANLIYVRRKDLAATPVNVYAETYAV